MAAQQGRGSNPWNRGGRGGRGRGASKQQQTESVAGQAESRFQKAQADMYAAAQKHYKPDYESSEEEDELESDNILGLVLQSYSQLGGTGDDLGRTQRFLEDAFQSGAATCLVCIATVKRTDAIWSCHECHCFFHLACVQRWARDSVAHQKMAADEDPRKKTVVEFNWACPKCRREYSSAETPQRYECFCGKTTDPTFHPWNVPHSCGETCGKQLQPPCGHACLLLCHPGPCPPCPKMVSSSCHCGGPARPQRCSRKAWSCAKPCSRSLACARHQCTEPCHPGACAACPRTSAQPCRCGAETQTRPCADPRWQCLRECGRPLSCGFHRCAAGCHEGACGPCPESRARRCPCGKVDHAGLPCNEPAPTCGDTCARVLECGQHACSRPCHRDKCGACLEVVLKSCRCGLHSRELPCGKPSVCDSKCRAARACGRHPCSRKCCDGNCPPCEKTCDRPLPCGRHKCAARCHRGPCYPCPLVANVACRCGSARLAVPCGRQKRTKPPRCSRACALPAACHHDARQSHRCHFGECPPCNLPCGQAHPRCPHSCPHPCHSAVWQTVEASKPAGPWERTLPTQELRCLPCPPCVVPMPTTCIGGHETRDWPCHAATPTSCQRPCGRPLACANHSCAKLCHAGGGQACAPCEAGCEKPRPDGCTHPCKKPCHPGACAPCGQMLKIRCHCGLAQLYVRCGEWTGCGSGDGKDGMQSCTGQCPKNFACGHRCTTPCHPGECPGAESCRHKVKTFCACRRLKRDFTCDVVRAGKASVDCDALCKEQAEQQRVKAEAERERKRMEEERLNQEEVERFEKKMQGRKKKDRRRIEKEEEVSFLKRYRVYLAGFVGIVLAASVWVFVY